MAAQCRRETRTHEIPIIAITSLSEEYGKEEALKGGCDAYIVKPINTRTLLEEIEAVVAAKARASLSEAVG